MYTPQVTRQSVLDSGQASQLRVVCEVCRKTEGMRVLCPARSGLQETVRENGAMALCIDNDSSRTLQAWQILAAD